MTVPLTALGWTPRLEALFEPYRAAGLVPARISLEHTHIYRVLTGTEEWLARVVGRLRHQASARTDFPAVGDWVAVEPPSHAGDARIKAVLPRVSRFSRRAAGDPTEEQIVAANIDTVFLVGGLDHDFNPTAARAIPAGRVGERGHARHRVEQGRPGRGSPDPG